MEEERLLFIKESFTIEITLLAKDILFIYISRLVINANKIKIVS